MRAVSFGAAWEHRERVETDVELEAIKRKLMSIINC
jgi:hypothetical protein